MNGTGDELDSRGNYSGVPSDSKIGIPVPTLKSDKYYKMNHKRKGIAAIFNHEHFDSSLELQPRRGTEEDALRLETTLQNIGFKILKYRDLSLTKFVLTLEELGSKDYRDCDCIFIAILTHGDTGILYAENSAYSHNLLFDPFTPDKCPSLAGKPKIFVIQACQGKELDPGIEVQKKLFNSNYSLSDHADTTASASSSSKDNNSTFKIPLRADFLIAYSTIPKFISWRHPEHGAYYIQAFCDELSEYWQELDFLTILTLVKNRMTAHDFESCEPDDPVKRGNKQVPCTISMLTRLLRFGVKIVNDSISNE